MKRACLALVIIALLILPLISLNEILVTAINTFSGYKISFSGRSGQLLSGVIFNDLEVYQKNKKMSIYAERAIIAARVTESIKKRKFICWVNLDKTRFLKTGDTTSAGVEERGILYLPFDPRWEYESLYFTLSYDIKTLCLEDINANSRDIVIQSSITYGIFDKNITSNIKIYVSPEVSESAMGDLKDLLMERAENGWFYLNTTFNGNVEKMNFSVKSDLFELNVRGE